MLGRHSSRGQGLCCPPDLISCAGSQPHWQEFFGDFMALDTHHFMVPVAGADMLINPRAIAQSGMPSEWVPGARSARKWCRALPCCIGLGDGASMLETSMSARCDVCAAAAERARRQRQGVATSPLRTAPGPAIVAAGTRSWTGSFRACRGSSLPCGGGLSSATSGIASMLDAWPRACTASRISSRCGWQELGLA